MAVRLITYDLAVGQDGTALEKYLRDNHTTMVAESSYVLDTTKEPATIVTEIRALTKNKIVVFVFTLVWPYAGFPAEPSKTVVDLLLPDPTKK